PDIVRNRSLDQGAGGQEQATILRAPEKQGAAGARVEDLAHPRLAYPIAKDPQGYFLWYQVEMPEDRVNDLARELRIRNN
ncbi:30S ribosomal protein S6, partial [Methylobacterium organophilum]|uniref:30S ribosomal protein S6 n=1 Tax=Methylobacterium organophilum TaxID=410 RepID=UPI001EE20C92